MNEQEEFNARIAATVDRRVWLSKNVPSCPKCAESQQIQLWCWLLAPAVWKCRRCKHKWDFEPETNKPKETQ